MYGTMPSDCVHCISGEPEGISAAILSKHKAAEQPQPSTRRGAIHDLPRLVAPQLHMLGLVKEVFSFKAQLGKFNDVAQVYGLLWEFYSEAYAFAWNPILAALPAVQGRSFGKSPPPEHPELGA